MTQNTPPKKPVYLIDGSSFLYRAYHALRPLNAPDGTPVQAVYGFCRMLKKLIDQFSPEYCALVWDSPGKTKRHEVFPEYKATRQAPPSDLFIQKDLIQEFARQINLHQVSQVGIEADDLIAALAKHFASTQHPVIIISSDKDLRQLVGEYVTMFDPFKDRILDTQEIEKEYGFPIAKLPFYFSLVGDASDNIPGIKGIGPKTAHDIVVQYNSLDDLYEHIDEVKTTPRTKQLLVDGEGSARLSLALFLPESVDTPVNLTDLQVPVNLFAQGYPFFQRLHFTSLLKQVEPALATKLTARPDAPAGASQQMSMFAAPSAATPKAAFEARCITTEQELEKLCHELAQLGDVSILRPSLRQGYGGQAGQSHDEAPLGAKLDQDEWGQEKQGHQARRGLAIDTETNSLNVYQADLVGISLCCTPGVAYYIPIRHNTGEKQLTPEYVIQKLKPILESPFIEKYLHHTKFDDHVLRHAGRLPIAEINSAHHESLVPRPARPEPVEGSKGTSAMGIKLANVTFDTMVAASLVKGDGDRVSLKVLSERYLGEQMATFQETVMQRGRKTFADVPLAEATGYAAADAHQTFSLKPLLEKELHEKNQSQLYQEIEHPLISILTDMEEEGILVNPAILQEIGANVTKQLAAITLEIARLIGTQEINLNLNSPQQVSNLLFTQLGIQTSSKTSRTRGYSTSTDVLSELVDQHPVVEKIINYRALYKIKSTYVDALLEAIDPTTQKIHTNFNQTLVATGRLSSSEPNLQNVPTDSATTPAIRSAFIAPPGHVFVSADYSQIELRVLAYLSRDESLLSAFAHHEDIHAKTASLLFGVPLEQVTRDQRQIAKRINFSILYGLTPYGLSKDLKIPLSDAKKYIETYMLQYPGVSAWMEQVVKETKEHGYVTTHWGRRRPVPGIYETNHSLYQLARRIAINTKAQGTAAELMKIGMIKLSKALAQEIPDAKMVLQIHDELLVTVPKKHAPQACTLVQKILQNVVDWDVPLDVTIRSGENWHDVSK